MERWQATPVGSIRHQLAEGPHYDANRARSSWVDIDTGELWTSDAERRAWATPAAEPLGVAVPHAEGGWVCGMGGAVVRVGETGSLAHLIEVEPPGVRMNDGKCDAVGRFFVGSKALDNTAGAGSLWRVDLDGSVARVLSGLTISNGLGWSPDCTTMYVTDSPSGRIDAYDYDATTGALGASRPFVQVDAQVGVPDGLAVDAEGCVWTAIWGGSRVQRYSPFGELLGEVAVAAPHVTSCAFVGPELNELLITTASAELSEEELRQAPLSGARFTVTLKARGREGQECRVDTSRLRLRA